MPTQPALALDDAAGEKRPSILVVDDDPRNLFAIEETLRELGHPIVLARSGREALRHLLAQDFALILLDVQMAEMDGYQTAELIRGRDRSRNVPIIFLTAVNKDQRHVFRGYATGAVDYIFKPVDPLVLRAKVAVFAELFRKAEAIRRQAALEKRLLEENLRVRIEKLQSERALRQHEQQYSLILRSLPVVLYTGRFGQTGLHLRFVSENAAAVTGFAPERFIAEPAFWLARIHRDDKARVLEELSELPRKGAVSTEYRWCFADGVEKWFLDQAVLSGQGEVSGTWLDVTARRQLEHELQRASRLEALGRLTGGIAHDFNNMLGVVIGNLDMLAGAAHDPVKAERLAGLALKGATRCAELTRHLLTFASRQPMQAKALDVQEFATGLSDLLEPSLDEAITLELEVAPDLPLISADPAQIESALLNLVLNARDAMPHGGQVRIALRMVDWRCAGSDRPEGCSAGDYIEITVSDTGAGMTPDVLARALEPFFTTKQPGQGTGLGLSTTFGVVKQCGGHMTIESAPGEGTTVQLFLPACTDRCAGT